MMLSFFTGPSSPMWIHIVTVSSHLFVSVELKGAFSLKHANIKHPTLCKETFFYEFIFLRSKFLYDSENLYTSSFGYGELEKRGFRNRRDREDVKIPVYDFGEGCIFSQFLAIN